MSQFKYSWKSLGSLIAAQKNCMLLQKEQFRPCLCLLIIEAEEASLQQLSKTVSDVESEGYVVILLRMVVP